MNSKMYHWVVTIITLVLVIPSITTAFGNISIISVPSGATIIMDGQSTGATTPSTIESMSSGSHYVTLRLSGYQDYAKNVVVTDNATSTVSVTLTALQTTTQQITNGSIRIDSDPSNAAIFLNTEHQGRTPLTVYNLTPGTYRILIQKTGYQDWSDRFSVSAGLQTDVYATLDAEIPETTVMTTAPPPTTAKATTFRTSTVKVPTPWPGGSPTPSSPMSVVPIIGAIGLGLLVLKK